MKRLPPLNSLRAFAAAAQAGSFTLAGEALHVTQGAVSRQVKQLEVAIGVELFVREHQRVVLTSAGAELASTLSRLFEEMQLAVDRAKAPQPRQMLRLNVPETFATRWLAPRLTDFRARYPLVDLSITTGRISDERDARKFDAMVLFGREPRGSVPGEPIQREHHVMVSSPLLWNGTEPPQLHQATLLHVLDGEQRLPVWEQWVAAHGPRDLDVRPGLNFSTLDQAINAAVSGAGVVVVDQAMIVRELQSGALRRHHKQSLDGPCGYWFVHMTRKPEAMELTRAFRDWMMEQVRQSGPVAGLPATR